MTDDQTGRPFPRWLIAAGVLALTVLLTAALLGRPQRPVVPSARAHRGSLLVPILADGTLEPLPGGQLRAGDPATVAAILVREGDRVHRGQLLVRLENAELASKALEARGELARLRVDRESARGELDEARRELGRLQKIVDENRRLLAAGAITRAAAEADEFAQRRAQEKMRVAQARLESLSADRGSRWSAAEDAAAGLSRRVDALSVRAPADGIVFGLPRQVGESVAAGDLVAGVADPVRRRVRARVDQPDLPRIRPGQRLLVTFDGLPDRQWHGNVSLVSPGLREFGGRQVAELLGELEDSATALPPNASVNVRIIVGEKQNAILVPRAALQRGGGQRFVWVVDSKRLHRRPVEVGLVGLNEVEVTSGLREGERVAIPGAIPFSEGMRVAVREG
jgi:HlyD family secretion protein